MPFGKHHIPLRVTMLKELAAELDGLGVPRGEVVTPDGPADTAPGADSAFRTTNMPYLPIGDRDTDLGRARVVHDDLMVRDVDDLERRHFLFIWPDTVWHPHYHAGELAGFIAVMSADEKPSPLRRI